MLNVLYRSKNASVTRFRASRALSNTHKKVFVHFERITCHGKTHLTGNMECLGTSLDLLVVLTYPSYLQRKREGQKREKVRSREGSNRLSDCRPILMYVCRLPLHFHCEIKMQDKNFVATLRFVGLFTFR